MTTDNVSQWSQIMTMLVWGKRAGQRLKRDPYPTVALHSKLVVHTRVNYLHSAFRVRRIICLRETDGVRRGFTWLSCMTVRQPWGLEIMPSLAIITDHNEDRA